MKRVCLLFIFTLFCAELHSQDRVDNFYSLLSSPNLQKKSSVMTFTKTDNGVIEKVESQRLGNGIHRFWRDYWRKASEQIDSLNIIDYKQDTVFIFQSFNGANPYQPFTMIVCDSSRVVIGYGSVNHLNDAEGWPFYYDSFHPILIEPVLKWDMSEIKRVILNYGTKPGEIEGPVWLTIDRIIIRDHKKIDTSAIHLDGMSVFGLRRTNNILH